jgi:hypothetical protein
VPAQLLVISDLEKDLAFGEKLAQAAGFDWIYAYDGKGIRSACERNEQTLVLWNAEDPERTRVLAPVIARCLDPTRVFAVTPKALHEHPHLFDHPVFGHHLYRRYDAPAESLYSKLFGAVLTDKPFGVLRFFPGNSARGKIVMTRSRHKRPVVQAVENHLAKQGILSRLSKLVAQAVDELVMNALFDAPVRSDGTPTRRDTDRAADFPLESREFVELEFCSSPDYLGVCVSDQFGSLKKDKLMRFLRKDYRTEEYKVQDRDPGAGLGLNGLIQTGLSILFISQPKFRTEVMVFFPRVKTFKEFRESFRFLSVISR